MSLLSPLLFGFTSAEYIQRLNPSASKLASLLYKRTKIRWNILMSKQPVNAVVIHIPQIHKYRRKCKHKKHGSFVFLVHRTNWFSCLTVIALSRGVLVVSTGSMVCCNVSAAVSRCRRIESLVMVSRSMVKPHCC